MRISEYIPADKLSDFDRLIKKLDGRYLSNPQLMIFGEEEDYHVHYEYDDVNNYNKHAKEWEKIIAKKEQTEKSFWKKVLSRLKHNKENS